MTGLPCTPDCTCGRHIGFFHGHSQWVNGSHPHHSPTYNSWSMMKQRCFNPKHTAYRYYGGRGVTVCDRWLMFANFLADMGPRPDGLELDRIDNDGNYEPGNCRWTTRSEQMVNRRRQSNYDRPSRVNECGHPDRPHKARGKCGACYLRWRQSTDERDPRYLSQGAA